MLICSVCRLSLLCVSGRAVRIYFCFDNRKVFITTNCWQSRSWIQVFWFSVEVLWTTHQEYTVTLLSIDRSSEGPITFQKWYQHSLSRCSDHAFSLLLHDPNHSPLSETLQADFRRQAYTVTTSVMDTPLISPSLGLTEYRLNVFDLRIPSCLVAVPDGRGKLYFTIWGFLSQQWWLLLHLRLRFFWGWGPSLGNWI